jgi:simple sugar transport system ATP-binding protein
MNLAVRMRGIGKSFGAVRALDEVHLEVEAGTIHALVGENGAGKTTLMRILYGAIHATDGTFEVKGQPAKFRNSAGAIRAGIGMVSQHYSIIPDLSCLDNLMLGAEPGWTIDKRAAEQRATELAQRMGFEFDWSAEASTLSPAGAQKLEILKLLWRKAEIMILDEPTAMLSPADSDALYGSLKQLVADGATVIVVTHRLPEVMQHCRDVTVLRGGKFITAKRVAETNPAELAELIVGHAMPAPSVRSVPDNAEDLLRVVNLTVAGHRGDDAVKSATFALHKGEVVGIAGVDGSGQRELFQALMGTSKLRHGEIILGNWSLHEHSIAERLRMGLRLIPEDRHEEGVVEEWSLELNAALGLQRFPPLAVGTIVNDEARHQAANEMARRFNTKHGGIRQPMSSLSGGNQQRFVAGRALFLTPRLILAFQPARGLDIDATRHVYDGIYEECAKGAGALVVSFDLDELLQFCDRIIVMNGGVVTQPNSRDRAVIGRHMVGVAS